MLHCNGLVHGDVSPKNIIISSNDAVLTDYDLVTQIGQVAFSPRTVAFCSPEREAGMPVSASDDVYALAPSFSLSMGA